MRVTVYLDSDKKVEIHETVSILPTIIENRDGMKIEFENVSFKYPATDQYLKDASFKCRSRIHWNRW